MNVPIIYEDENVIAVNKPSGLVVHGDGRTNEKTLVDWVHESYPEIKDVGEPMILENGEKIERPGIVHRLDKETSGILLIAKNQETFLFLKEKFQNNEIKKIYKAIVYGKLKSDEGTINLPIGRSRADFRLKSARQEARGEKREAETRYQVIVKTDHYSFVEIYPKTGRTHQIRVHFKEIGHSVVCDTLYASKRECPKELGRLGLHAYALEFVNSSGIQMRLEAPLPRNMKEVLDILFPDLRVV